MVLLHGFPWTTDSSSWTVQSCLSFFHSNFLISDPPASDVSMVIDLCEMASPQVKLLVQKNLHPWYAYGFVNFASSFLLKTILNASLFTSKLFSRLFFFLYSFSLPTKIFFHHLLFDFSDFLPFQKHFTSLLNVKMPQSRQLFNLFCNCMSVWKIISSPKVTSLHIKGLLS